MGKAFETDKHGYKTADVDRFVAENNKVIADLKEHIAELKSDLAEKNTELKSFKQKQDLIVKSIMSAVQKAEQIENLIKQKYVGEMAHLEAFHQQWTSYYKRLIEKYPLSDELNALNLFNRRVSAILTDEADPKEQFNQAKEQFDSENNRLKKKYVGFIPVDSPEGVQQNGKDDGIDLSNFNPEENIRQMLRRQAAEEEERLKKQAKSAPKPKTATASKAGATPKPAAKDLGVSASGFSFDEALNPTEQLSDILKQLGIDLEDK